MVLLDASAIIAYLEGDDGVVEFIEASATEPLTTVPLVRFEVYQGEIFKPGQADFETLDEHLDWLRITPTNHDTARRAAELQASLRAAGSALAPRDAFIAGAAAEQNQTLAHRDSDFDVPALDDELEIARL